MWPVPSEKSRMTSSPEVTAAAKVLNQNHEGLTARDVAKLVLEAAESAREKSAKFSAIGQFSLPDGSLNHIVIAPFSTELQARKAGEGLQYDPKTKTGSGRFMVVPLVNDHRQAWDLIRPPAVDPHEWITQSIERQRAGQSDPPNLDGLYKASYWERDKW